MSRRRILVAVENASLRDPIVAKLEAVGYVVTSADDGKSAVRAMEFQIPDLVFIELSIPFLDGFTLLARIRSESNWHHLPVVALADDHHPETERRVRQLGVEEYLVKGDYTLPRLVERIKQIFKNEASTLAEKYGRILAPLAHDPERFLGGFEHVGADVVSPETAPRQPQPQSRALRVASELARSVADKIPEELSALANDGAVTDDALRTVVTKHVDLVERVLALLNCPLYLQPQPVTTFEEALERYELRLIQSLLVMLAIADAFSTLTKDDDRSTAFWEHAVGVSWLMVQLTYKPSPKVLPNYYLVGLFHDFFEIVLRREFPQDFVRCEQVAVQERRSFCSMSEAVFGMSASKIASTALAEFELPTAVRRAVVQHLETSACGAPNNGNTMSQFLALADSLAHGCLLATSRSAIVRPISKGEYRRTVGISSPITLKSADFRESVRHAIGTIFPETRDRFGLDLPQSKARIWYARHDYYSSPDPIAEALQGMAEVDTHLRLPAHPEQMKDFSGVVVTAADAGADLVSLPDLQRLLVHSKQRVKGLYIVDKIHEALAKEADATGGLTMSSTALSLDELAEFVESIS